MQINELFFLGGGVAVARVKAAALRCWKLERDMKYFSVFDIKQNKSKNVVFKNFNRGWNRLWALGFTST